MPATFARSATSLLMTPATRAFLIAATLAIVAAASGGLLPHGMVWDCDGPGCPYPAVIGRTGVFLAETARVVLVVCSAVTAGGATWAATRARTRVLGAISVLSAVGLFGWLVVIAEKGLDGRVVLAHDLIVGAWLLSLGAAAWASSRCWRDR
ncbi:MAG: hypothetical protein FJX78_02960 [Armatimonadetes bacterium]|nr:hypothetical protein [Armatimonadota bacterium]